jgi:hypothetical protein
MSQRHSSLCGFDMLSGKKVGQYGYMLAHETARQDQRPSQFLRDHQTGIKSSDWRRSTTDAESSNAGTACKTPGDWSRLRGQQLKLEGGPQEVLLPQFQKGPGTMERKREREMLRLGRSGGKRRHKSRAIEQPMYSKVRGCFGKTPSGRNDSGGLSTVCTSLTTCQCFFFLSESLRYST